MGVEVVEEVFRSWLHHGQSGCFFASQIASKSDLMFWEVLQETLDGKGLMAAADAVDQAANAGKIAVLTFPRVTSMTKLAKIIVSFDQPPRWRMSRVGFPNPSDDIEGIRIAFQTKHGDRSTAMGFAPCLEMPITRRAPCVALALWGGPKSNPYFDRGALSMAHAPHPITTQAVHDGVWDNTVAATQKRLTIPPFDAVWLRKVSFCLPREHVDTLFAQNTARSPSEGNT